MPPVNILIKPASSACNMACTYCFYRDVAENRVCAFQGMLSLEKIEKIIQAGMEYAEHICSFAFQGGEPTLAGLEFFRGVIALQKKYQKADVHIQNAIQTNGFAINEEWAKFFAENKFLVGLSLDGPADMHNLHRVDRGNSGTFNAVMRTVRLFQKHGVEFNVLCVVTGRNARGIAQIYQFYRKHGLKWLQFIPCLEPLEDERGRAKYHLSTKTYGAFLIRLFDLWLDDLKRGNYVSIRHFDNWMSILLGERPEACNMTGQCSIQFVIEGDGGVYPCDFYVLDKWRLGTVGEMSFAAMRQSDTAVQFVEESLSIPETCKVCRWYGLCRNGCRRDRAGKAGLDCYCEAYQDFFNARAKEMQLATRMILAMRQRG